jgi:hypothetical protein
MNRTYCVYILANRSRSLYTGVTGKPHGRRSIVKREGRVASDERKGKQVPACGRQASPPFATIFCARLLRTNAGLGAYLDWEAWEMVEMMRRLARTR